MIVNIGTDQVNLTDVFTLNETAAQLWEHIGENEFSCEELADWLCSEYEVERDVALRDVQRQVAEWKTFGLAE